MSEDNECPLCQSSTNLLPADKLGEDPREHNNYALYQCILCELIFSIPFRSAGSEHYQEVEQYLDRWEFKHVFETTKLRDSKILEIGCGEGSFIQQANQYNNHVVGVDFNQSAITKASQKKLNAELLCVNADKLEDELKEYSDFDMVSAFHILEHLDNLEKFLNLCAGKLKNNGYLVLATPSENRFSLLFNAREWWDRPPHHITRWGDRSFKQLARITNCDIELISYQKLDHQKFHAQLVSWVYRKTIRRIDVKGVGFRIINTSFRPLSYTLVVWLNSRICNRVSGHSVLVILRKH